MFKCTTKFWLPIIFFLFFFFALRPKMWVEKELRIGNNPPCIKNLKNSASVFF